MNPYLQNLSRIEFLMTFACTGRCKHCSEGEHTHKGEHLDGKITSELVRSVESEYGIKSVMTFGGEPFLYPDEVFAIHAAARDVKIAERQIITNGFFSHDEAKIKHIAETLAECGVNNLLLSVDAFHQETIPLEPIMAFAKALLALSIQNFRVHPAWLVSEEADNPYNNKTRDILAKFNAIGIPTSGGNVIFPSGNALTYLGEYFDSSVQRESKYAQDPRNIQAICILPNGDVLNGNIYKTDILEILTNYTPEE